MPEHNPKHQREALSIETLSTSALVPDPNNAREHTDKQITKLAAAIDRFGFNNPLLIDENNQVLAGNGRLEAAKRLDHKSVPCIRLSGLTPPEKKALALADNKMGDLSKFDERKLRTVLLDLTGVDFDVELTGFDTAEVDFCIEGEASVEDSDPADILPALLAAAVSQLGDLWLLGDHRIVCGNALEAITYEALLGGELAQMVFTDCPFNVPVKGHVSGLGRRQHREFAMASGEMSDEEFCKFLSTYMRHVAAQSADGSIHYHCIDWRHVETLVSCGRGVYSELKNICVWAKTNGGLGSLYRSQHEMVAVFKNGTSPHINNVQLGKYGRYRSNLWTYAGANAFGRTRDSDLEAHPTVKPVALVADAIRDCSKRGGVILDPFLGSGTTVLAAERMGRRAAGLEIDPLYVDTAIRRWQLLTGKRAYLAGDGRSFDEVALTRTRQVELAATSKEAGDVV